MRCSDGCGDQRKSDPRELRRQFRFSTRRWRWNPARHAAHQPVNSFAILKAGRSAGDDGAGGCQLGQALPHHRNRNASLLREFQVESLTVFLEAKEDVAHGGTNARARTVPDPITPGHGSGATRLHPIAPISTFTHWPLGAKYLDFLNGCFHEA